MCGIAGQIDFDGSCRKWEPAYGAMQASLRRRGPDQEGLWLTPQAALIHTRLCVVDIARGTQPMVLRQGGRELALVYNGELYNTEELRGELLALGHRFQGHSDTEVLLHSYAQWGADCVEKFNGIFAFAVWDAGSQRLFLARDRIGVKPLFYALPQGGGLLFASEIKALLAHPLVPAQADGQTVAEVMLLGPGRTPGCGVFRGVLEVPPACCGFYDRDGLRLRRYWRLTDQEHPEGFEETVEHVRDLVLDAIERQLVSDVPVGTFLSGGLDSSLISSVAARRFRAEGKLLQTFSVDYAENQKYFTASKFQPTSDSGYITQMADYLGSDHHLIQLDSGDLAQALDAAVEARDLPGMADVDSSLLLFCEKIKPHVTVALSGECADEIFGGYPWYRDPEIRERYGFPWAQSTEYRESFLTPEWRARLDGAELIDARYRATLADTDLLPGRAGVEKRMKEMVNLNVQWFMQTLLDRKDRMSMYSGLEVRVPFCDWRIAEYLYSVPWEWKDYQCVEKGLLRHAMEGWLPEEVLWRKKSPYPKTHHPAYLAAVSGRLRQVLDTPNAPLFQFVGRAALEQLLSSRRATPWYGQLMTTPQTIAYFVQVNYWLEHYQIRLV